MLDHVGCKKKQTVNFILELKVQTLKALCIEYKSKYEQMDAKMAMKYNQQEEIYMNQINSLQHQILNQKSELDKMEQKINATRQEVTATTTKFQKQTKLLKTETKKLKDKIKKLSEETIQKDNEIHNLIYDVAEKEKEIGILHNHLLKKVQYNYKPHFPSPSTMKVNKSVSWSNVSNFNSNESELKSSFDVSQNVSSYQQKHNKIKSYKKRKKWTNTMRQSPLLEPINVMMRPLNSDKSFSIYSLDFNDKGTTPFLCQQYPIGYVSINTPSLKNSETEISQDVNVKEESSKHCKN